jgi:hypothetical protein
MIQKADSPEPVTRRRLRKIALLVLFALLPGTLAGLYLYERFADEASLQEAIEEADRLDPDWRIVDLEAHRKDISDAENGVLQALKARQLIPALLFPWRIYEPPDAPLNQSPGEPPILRAEEQVQRIRSELQRAQTALEEARRLANIPQGRQHLKWQADYKTRILLDLPNPYIGQDLFEVAILLDYDAMLRAQEGDSARALRSARALVNTARCIGDEPSPASHYARMGIQSRAWRRLECVLAQGEPRAADLELTQRAFEREAEEPLLYYALRGERGILDDFLASVQAGGLPFKVVRRHLDRLKQTVKREEKSQFEENLEALTLIITARKQRGELLLFLNRAVEMARSLPDQQADRIEQLAGDSLKNRPALMVQLEAEAARHLADYADRRRAEMRCAVLALAAERYRQTRGQWPGCLDDLVAHYVARIPHDPFDGRPLKLAKHAEGIVIYSVGVDGVDNGGMINRMRPTAPGSDLGFRLWDVKYRRQPARFKRWPEEQAPALPPGATGELTAPPARVGA